MSEVAKDYSIKLFGKTIDLLPYNLVQHTTLPEQVAQSSSVTSTSQDTKDLSRGEITGSTHEYESTNPADETSSEISDGVAPPTCPKNDSLFQESSNKKEEPNDSTASDEKTLKKPQEILPCPRCESMDTKFCYFNNYNVNQPRYFCRKCQRYWTCGGTMRNVPIGSGRRKNKNNVAIQNYYRHITVQENGAHLNPNGFLILDEGSNKSSNTPLNSTENGFPVTFYPATSYWGSAVPSGFWNVPWFPRPTNPVPSILGKHPREETTIRPSVLVPKSLRIDDPNEAAKSSIWTTLGINNEKIGSSCIFKPFEPKVNVHRSVDNTAMVLQSNPAALSRSHNFHETA